MQDASANFADAASAGAVTWLEPAVYADWARNGYGATGSIDDLSGQINGLVVEHALNDGLPDDVSFVTESGVPTMTGDLGGNDQLTAAGYFSQFNASSPVSAYDRDVAPVKFDHGLVTSAGPERIRLFTGQMTDVPVKAGRASLEALSATRLALARLVQPPVRSRREQRLPFGLNVTWAVSYVLHACGVYPSPPAMAGCRLHLPLYGSGHAFAPASNTMLSNPAGVVQGVRRRVGDSGLDFYAYEPRTVRGPWVGGVKARVTATELLGVLGSIFFDTAEDDLVAGDDWLSQAGSRGRIQFWVRGDAADANNTPGGSANFDWGQSGTFWLAGMEAGSTFPPTAPYVVAGVNLSRQVFLKVFDGTNNATLTASASLPTDGDWHFVGAAWDIAGQKLWVRLDSVTQTSTPTLSTAGLGAVQGAADVLTFAFALPSADFQFTTGTGADPDDTPAWLNNAVWTRGATVYPSALELEVLAEPTPREAWEYINDLAQAEIAAVRIDENDQMLYAPRGYFATVEKQTVAATITTAADAAAPEVTLDPSKVRNVARVTYNQTWVDEVGSLVLEFRTILTLPPGVSTYRLALDAPATRVKGGELDMLTAEQISGVDPSPPAWSFVTINSEPNGTGTYATSTEVLPEITEWHADEVVVRFTNATTSTWYLTNNATTTGFPFLGVYAFDIHQNTASVTEVFDPSVTVRGERAIAVDLPTIQRETDARRVARRLVCDLAYAVPVVESVEAFGDPRRQPGDLVTFTDEETGVSGAWRSFVVKHRVDGADYRQTLKLRRAPLVGRWGDGVSRWGTAIWAGEE